METEYLSGMLRFKPDFLKTIADYLNIFNLNIISVGSGTGYLEYHLEKKLRGKKILCVDPMYASYSKEHKTEKKLPTYNTIDDASIAGENIGDSVIILNWPSPDDWNSLKVVNNTLIDLDAASKNNPYDYSAIIKYKPKVFIVSYEKKGSSGSTKLISMLNNQEITEPLYIKAFDLKNKDYLVSNVIEIDKIKYHLFYSHYISGMTTDGSNKQSFIVPQVFTLVMYIREDCKNDYQVGTNPPTIIQEKIFIDYENRSFRFL